MKSCKHLGNVHQGEHVNFTAGTTIAGGISVLAESDDGSTHSAQGPAALFNAAAAELSVLDAPIAVRAASDINDTEEGEAASFVTTPAASNVSTILSSPEASSITFNGDDANDIGTDDLLATPSAVSDVAVEEAAEETLQDEADYRLHHK